MKIIFKWTLFFIICSLTIFGNAQNDQIELRGIILDESGNAVPYVAVGIVKKYIGTSSTEDGEFSFFATKNELQDSLSVSSLGFEPFKIMVDDYLKLEKQEIVLIETSTELDAVVLLSSVDYVQKALENLRDNTLSIPHKLEMLFRRTTTESNKPKFLVENYIKIKDKGPSYSPGVIQVIESRKSADYRIWKSKQWQHSINSLFNLNPLRPHASQHKRNLKKFEWKQIGDSSFEGQDVIILRGQNPKVDWERITLYIGLDNYEVYRIERNSSLFIYKRHHSGKLVLSYFKNEWQIKNENVPEEYQNTAANPTSYKTEAFVFNIDTDKKEARKVYPFGDDTDMGLIELPYNADFWKSLSLPPDTKFYKSIKDGLESNYGVSLETQFELVNN